MINALPMPDVFNYDKELFFKCQREMLEMCTQPSKSKGYEVVLTRNCGIYKSGQRGVIRNLDACQILRKINEYNSNLTYSKCKFKLPDLNCMYDFYPILKRDGRMEVSIYHSHISTFDFKRFDTQSVMELEIDTMEKQKIRKHKNSVVVQSAKISGSQLSLFDN